MRHFSAFIKPGAVILRASGGLSPNSVCAKNPDGTVTAVMANTLDTARTARLTYGMQSVTVELPPHAVATVSYTHLDVYKRQGGRNARILRNTGSSKAFFLNFARCIDARFHCGAGLGGFA